MDENPADGTTWVQTAVSNEVELFTVENATLGYVTSVNLVQVLADASKVGAADLVDVLMVGTTNYEGLTTAIGSTHPSWELITGTAHYINPDTAAAWDMAGGELDDVEIGVKLV